MAEAREEEVAAAKAAAKAAAAQGWAGPRRSRGGGGGRGGLGDSGGRKPLPAAAMADRGVPQRNGAERDPEISAPFSSRAPSPPSPTSP